MACQLPGHDVGNPLLTDNLLYVPHQRWRAGGARPDRFTREVVELHSDNDKGVWSQPLLVDGTLYVSSMDHNLYRARRRRPATNQMEARSGRRGSVDAGLRQRRAVHRQLSGARSSRSRTDGSIVAQYTTNDWVWGAPAVVDDMVYVTDLGGYVYALKDIGQQPR